MSPSLTFAFGSNGAGQLGVGHTEDLSIPEAVKFDEDENVTIIATGGNHTLFLLSDGRVIACGNNEHGQCLSDKTTGDLITTPREVSLRQSDYKHEAMFKDVAATWSASIVVTKTNTCYVAGQGLSGELGLGKRITAVEKPVPIPDFPPSGTSIMQIASCMAHTVVVLSNGEAYGWGRGRKGQLGEPSCDVWQPRKIVGIQSAVKAVCGKDFTCIIDTSGQISMLGPSKLDRFNVRSGAPAVVPGWRDIHASWGSVVVHGTEQTAAEWYIKAWGRDDHGQLPPQDLPKISAIAAGSEHCLALTDTGEVLAWGWGEHGNCGLPTDAAGDVKGRWNRITLPYSAIKIFAGCATSFTIVSENHR